MYVGFSIHCPLAHHTINSVLKLPIVMALSLNCSVFLLRLQSLKAEKLYGFEPELFCFTPRLQSLKAEKLYGFKP